MFFRDFMDGGARPFSIGGVICLVNSVNERDSNVLNSLFVLLVIEKPLRGTGGSNYDSLKVTKCLVIYLLTSLNGLTRLLLSALACFGTLRV